MRGVLFIENRVPFPTADLRGPIRGLGWLGNERGVARVRRRPEIRTPAKSCRTRRCARALADVQGDDPSGGRPGSVVKFIDANAIRLRHWRGCSFGASGHPAYKAARVRGRLLAVAPLYPVPVTDHRASRSEVVASRGPACERGNSVGVPDARSWAARSRFPADGSPRLRARQNVCQAHIFMA